MFLEGVFCIKDGARSQCKISFADREHGLHQRNLFFPNTRALSFRYMGPECWCSRTRFLR